MPDELGRGESLHCAGGHAEWFPNKRGKMALSETPCLKYGQGESKEK
jgi:hypothetical protein